MDEKSADLTIVDTHALSRFGWLLRRAVIAAYEDNCFGIAKGAAYSFLLALFPILTTLTSILLRIRAQEVVHVISVFILQVVPPGTEDLVRSRLTGSARLNALPIVVAAVFSLWAGSGAMLSLMEGFQAAYRIPAGRPFLKQRSMAIFLVLVAALPAVLASALIIFGNRAEHDFILVVHHSTGGEEISAPIRFFWRVGRYALAFATTTFVTGLLYYFGPNHRPEPDTTPNYTSRFLRVWPGALVATLLWMLVTAGFAWYVGHIANYSLFYGSLGTVVILLIWLYIIAVLALIGCEFNAEHERMETLLSLGTGNPK